MGVLVQVSATTCHNLSNKPPRGGGGEGCIIFRERGPYLKLDQRRQMQVVNTLLFHITLIPIRNLLIIFLVKMRDFLKEAIKINVG